MVFGKAWRKHEPRTSLLDPQSQGLPMLFLQKSFWKFFVNLAEKMSNFKFCFLRNAEKAVNCLKWSKSNNVLEKFTKFEDAVMCPGLQGSLLNSNKNQTRTRNLKWLCSFQLHKLGIENHYTNTLVTKPFFWLNMFVIKIMMKNSLAM
jgi:hypothetical protein